MKFFDLEDSCFAALAPRTSSRKEVRWYVKCRGAEGRGNANGVLLEEDDLRLADIFDVMY